MTTYENQCLQNATAMLQAIPEPLGFELKCSSRGPYYLRSKECFIELCFERYDSSSCTMEIGSPKYPKRTMSFWILCHIRGVPVSDDDSFSATGQILAQNFMDILTGDFSLRKEHEILAPRMLDRALDVMDLPNDHPTRIRFDNCDIRWLYDLEQSD